MQWQRRLWDTGLIVSLQELRDASDAAQFGSLSKQAVKWLALSIDARAARDPGAGEGDGLGRMRAVLRADLTSGGANHRELAAWTEDVRHMYLGRWRDAARGSAGVGREPLARALATHLLGERFSAQFLREWIDEIRLRATVVEPAHLVEATMDLCAIPPKRFDVMLVFEKPPPRRFARPLEWRTAREVSAWLADEGHAGIRQHGGLQLTFEVRALEREEALLRLDSNGPIDQSLELLSHLNVSPDAVAAAAGWSAVESLLSAPGDEDKAVTADRLADLVACAWPRAELTTIAWARVYQTRGKPDPLAQELESFPTNRQRADRILGAISSGEDLGLTRLAERLAIRRMERLIGAPRTDLLAVSRRVAACLRRLYRQRNLVVHGGQTAGFGLAQALDLAAPVVGAGLDRVTHSALVADRHPLDLAARARLEIHRAGTKSAPALTELLE